MKQSSIRYIVLFALFILLVCFPLFYNLGNLTIRIWDEARLATNACEMYQNGNWMVTYFEGKPDMWNTKPPFMIWCQVLCIKLVGINEFALRFPSAIAALLTCVIAMLFSIKYVKNYWFGIISVLFLMTSKGYNIPHVNRTGDYDSMLVLFMTGLSLSIFMYFELKEKKYLYLFFTFLILACLTKGVAGLLFLPGIFLYALWQKQLIPLLKNKNTYIGIIAFLIIVVGYYLLREYYNPEYLPAVFKNEMGGRYLNVLENNSQPFSFYFKSLFGEFFFFQPLLLSIGGLLIIAPFIQNRQKVIKLISNYSSFFHLAGFTLIVSVSYLLIILGSYTKLYWYLAPLYPLLSIFLAIILYVIFESLKNNRFFNETLKVNIVPVVFLLLVFIFPYKHIFKNYAFTTKENCYIKDDESNQLSYFLRDGLEGKYDLNNRRIAYEPVNFVHEIPYYPHILFYIHLLNDQGNNVALKSWTLLEAGDKVIAFQPNVKDYIQSNYSYEIILQKKDVVEYSILNKKE